MGFPPCRSARTYYTKGNLMRFYSMVRDPRDEVQRRRFRATMVLLAIVEGALSLWLFEHHPWWSGLFAAGTSTALASVVRGQP